MMSQNRAKGDSIPTIDGVGGSICHPGRWRILRCPWRHTVPVRRGAKCDVSVFACKIPVSRASAHARSTAVTMGWTGEAPSQGRKHTAVAARPLEYLVTGCLHCRPVRQIPLSTRSSPPPTRRLESFVFRLGRHVTPDGLVMACVSRRPGLTNYYVQRPQPSFLARWGC
jgi:hypothetical protein